MTLEERKKVLISQFIYHLNKRYLLGDMIKDSQLVFATILLDNLLYAQRQKYTSKVLILENLLRELEYECLNN